MVLDVPAYCRFRDMSNRPNVVAATPQGRQLRAQMSKFLPQDTRGIALKLGRQLCRSHARVALDTHVYVIRHDFQGMQRTMQFVSLERKQDFQALSHRPQQYRLAILRAKDEVIFERKDGVSVTCIPVMFHGQSITYCSTKFNYLTQ